MIEQGGSSLYQALGQKVSGLSTNWQKKRTLPRANFNLLKARRRTSEWIAHDQLWLSLPLKRMLFQGHVGESAPVRKSIFFAQAC
jgi:hypothetical protein